MKQTIPSELKDFHERNHCAEMEQRCSHEKSFTAESKLNWTRRQKSRLNCPRNGNGRSLPSVAPHLLGGLERSLELWFSHLVKDSKRRRWPSTVGRNRNDNPPIVRPPDGRRFNSQVVNK